MRQRNPKIMNDLWFDGQDCGPALRSDVFGQWFPGSSERLFFGVHDIELGKIDEKIIDFLRVNGYRVTDYIKGLAENTNVPSGKKPKIQKIGAILNKISKSTLLLYEQSCYRDLGGEIGFMISRNADDIANASTGQSWKSCLTIDADCGQYSTSLYEEVRCGGLIAYAGGDNFIRSHGKKGARSRIMIRRVSDDHGRNIAIQEHTFYGKMCFGDTTGDYDDYFKGHYDEMFRLALREKLRTLNGSVDPSIYFRRGGRYSDSFQKDMVLFEFQYLLTREEFLEFFVGVCDIVKKNWRHPIYAPVVDLSKFTKFDNNNIFFGESFDYHNLMYDFGLFLTKESAIDFMDEFWNNIVHLTCEDAKSGFSGFSSWEDFCKIDRLGEVTLLDVFSSTLFTHDELGDELPGTIYPLLKDERTANIIYDNLSELLNTVVRESEFFEFQYRRFLSAILEEIRRETEAQNGLKIKNINFLAMS